MPNKKTLSERRRLLIRRFRDRNRRFRKLAPSQQRLKVIKDVITYLEEGKITARRGRYLVLRGYKKVINDSDQLHELVEQAKCDACGIGSIFIAAVMLNNKLKISDLNGSYGSSAADGIKTEGVEDWAMRSYLATWFDGEQMNLIESAFEEDNAYAAGTASQAAAEFGMSYNSDHERLLAICKNILANNGRFVPEAELEQRRNE